MESLQQWLAEPEGTNLEFKEAKQNYHFEKLVDYCVALANEGGGKIILGVTDRRPRRIVGTAAFAEPGRTEAGLHDRLMHRIPVEEKVTPDGRVLIVHVPGRLPGTAWQINGRYLKRAGDDLVAMGDTELRAIFAETGPDFSAQICAEASISDLDPSSIEILRRLWLRKSGNQELAILPDDRLLTDAELLVDGRMTYAALILLGTHDALGRLLAQAEIIFEYRSNEAPGPAAARHEYRQGFLPILDDLWRLINLRNDLQHFQQGLFVWDIPTFNDRAIREALLNAVSHRDYRNGGSVFVRQYPRRIEIVSPGGFPPGITPTNILWQQNPRNRRIAEVLSKCGLVERAGQGFDFIVRECIRQSKPLPDLSLTDDHSVWLTLHGEIQDPDFLRFLEEVGAERTALFSTDDFLVVDLVNREMPIPDNLKSRVEPLLEQGVIERLGRGRGARLLLSQRFHRHLGKAGVYTSKRGLDHDTNKALLEKHLLNQRDVGAPLADLQQVLPAQPERAIQLLLQEMRKEGRVELRGQRRWARWFAISKNQNES
jgi:ATP-dependent DNA helicase RecG